MSEFSKPVEKVLYSAGALAVSGLVLAIRSQRELQRKNAELTTQNTELTVRLARAEKQATIDPLTGLPRRPVLERAFTGLQSSHSSRATDGPKTKHSLVLMDLDNFKQLNDTEGHPKGDGALQSVADIMRANTRDRDVPVRWAGDEFGILLPRANAHEAEQVAERIRVEIEKAGIGAKHLPITASIGIAEINLDLPFGASYDIADAALYEAKQAGRNRICIAALTEELE